MFDHENEGQSDGVQHSQWSHSMENINLYKRRTSQFVDSSHRFRNIHVSKFVTLNM